MSELLDCRPRDSKVILEDFVGRAGDEMPVSSYEEMVAIFGPEVASALTIATLAYGRPPKHPNSKAMAVLENTTRRGIVRSVVQSGLENDTPNTIYLAEYRRRLLIRDKRVRWINVSVDGVGFGAAVASPEGFFMPEANRDSSIEVMSEMGKRGYFRGYEEAAKLQKERPLAFNSFLRTASDLTSRLLEVIPTEV